MTEFWDFEVFGVLLGFLEGAAGNGGAAPIAPSCGDRLFSHHGSDSWRPTHITINSPGPPRWERGFEDTGWKVLKFDIPVAKQ